MAESHHHEKQGTAMTAEASGGAPLGTPSGMSFIHHPLIPYDPNVVLYFAGGPVLLPFEYTGWQDEVMSYKETAYISHSLNPMPTFSVKGSDAVRVPLAGARQRLRALPGRHRQARHHVRRAGLRHGRRRDAPPRRGRVHLLRDGGQLHRLRLRRRASGGPMAAPSARS